MIGASRAVTSAARERRLQLVETYLEHLNALGEPRPFQLDELARVRMGCALDRSAFDWEREVKRQARSKRSIATHAAAASAR